MKLQTPVIYVSDEEITVMEQTSLIHECTSHQFLTTYFLLNLYDCPW